MLSTSLYDERFNLALANYRAAAARSDRERAAHETSTMSRLITYMSEHGFIVDHAEGPNEPFYFVRNGYSPATAHVLLYNDLLAASTFQAEFEYLCYLYSHAQQWHVELQARICAKYATSPEERAYLASVLTYFGLSSAWLEVQP